jgi:hypothetical protein
MPRRFALEMVGTHRIVYSEGSNLPFFFWRLIAPIASVSLPLIMIKVKSLYRVLIASQGELWLNLHSVW